MGQLSVDLSVKVAELHRSLRREERRGVAFPRYFTAKLEPGKTPYDQVKWELRTATIGNDKGSVIFEQRYRSACRLVADRDQHCSQQVFSWAHGIAGARNQRGAACSPCGGHDCRLGLVRPLLQNQRGWREL